MLSTCGAGGLYPCLLKSSRPAKSFFPASANVFGTSSGSYHDPSKASRL